MKVYLLLGFLVLLALAICVFCCFVAIDQQRDVAINAVKSLAVRNATADIQRGTAYYQIVGTSDMAAVEAFDARFREHRIQALCHGCVISDLDGHYAAAYNQVLKAHLSETYGHDLINEFFRSYQAQQSAIVNERQKAT
jgi:hypothetical protein